MAHKLILCRNCGTRNRVPQGAYRSQLGCGRCGEPLVSSTSDLRRRRATRIAIPFVLAAIGLAWYFLVFEEEKVSSRKTTSAHHSDSRDTTSQPVFDAPQVPISPGVILAPPTRGVAPFEIRTKAGRDYFVKLVDLNGTDVMTIFVQGGRPLETAVPLGSYRMRYAVGGEWYGPVLLFGPETSTFQADEVFDFRLDGSMYTGYTVELILQSEGNLRTSKLPRGAF